MPTKLTMNYLPNTYYTDSIKITGKLTTKNNNILYSRPVILNIDGKKYTAKTDYNGVYSYNYKTKTPGKNNITASYAGNDYYVSSNIKKTFTVNKMPTKLTMNYLPNTYYTDNITITGKLTTKNNNILYSRPVILNIDGKKYTAKTDYNGVYTYNYKTKTPGKNNITASYAGNDYYVSSNVKKTFKVTRMPTKVDIRSYSYGEYHSLVSVSGVYKDNNDNALKNTKLNIYINGAKRTTKTDNYGQFFYSYTIQKVGKNTITVQYIGTNKYIGSKDTITYTAEKKTTRMKVYKPYYDSSSNKIIIEGYLCEKDNQIIKNAPITINVAGKYYKTKTDNYGNYYFSTKPTKEATNDITVSYAGSSVYKKSSNKTSIYTPISKKVTKITMNSISKTNKGEYVYITGEVTDNNYNPLVNVDVVLTINGNKYTTKTDYLGNYYYSYKTTKTGTNKVTATFKGNSKYKSSTTTKTFTVSSLYNTLEMYTYPLKNNNFPTTKRVGNDYFETWYQYYDGQWDKGVYIMVEDYYAQDMGDPANNLLTDATFYFKNSAGKIISRKYDSGNGGWMGHNLISGYTPYKVKVTYRKMTSNEKNLWNKGYGYNPKTGKWYSYF